MAKKHKPKRGSLAYSPRKRANREVPRFKAWPPNGKEPHLQGFAGYKAGMTHASLVDYRPTSTTSGREVEVPVTIIETPPLKICALRFYKRTPYGLKLLSDVWAKKLEPEIDKRVSLPKKRSARMKIPKEAADVRAIVYTQPKLVSSIPKKTPELMEIRIGGGDLKDRIKYGRSILGKAVDVSSFAKEGQMVDIATVTKGKGFQGVVRRWGVKLQKHKDSKHRRGRGPSGPRHPAWVRSSVPQAGQTGYYPRVEHNKRVLKVGEDGKEITPKGGFLRYGEVRNKYLVLHGSIPGPSKRLVGLRDAIRWRGVKVEKVDLKYLSIESKQGA